MKQMLTGISVLLPLISCLHAQQCSDTALGSSPKDHLGWATAAIGDLDGDGASEVAVGAPQVLNPVTRGGPVGPGFVRIYSGRSGALLSQIDGTQFGEVFGYVIVALGDHDGDGFAEASGDIDGDLVNDFLVAAPSYDGTRTDQGRVYLVSGATLTIAATIDNPSPTTGGSFGLGLTTLGNCTGDGRPEFAVGAPGWSASGGGIGGRAYLFGWGTGTVVVNLATRTGAPTSSGTRLGQALRGVGDATGDGQPDLLAYEKGTGKVYLLSWNNFAGTAVANLTAPGSGGTAFGSVLCGLGDLDADGSSEFAISDPSCATGGCTSTGTVHVYSATASGASLRRTLTRAPRAQLPQVWFGQSLAMLGDVDGDQISDLAIGAPFGDPVGTTTATVDAGELHLFSGAALLGPAPRPFAVFDGRPGEAMGRATAAPGDTDVDGRADVAAGAPYAAPTTSGPLGKVVIARHLSLATSYGNSCSMTAISAPEQHVPLEGGPCRGGSLQLHCTQLPSNSLCLVIAGTATTFVPGFLQPPCELLVLPATTLGIVPGNQTFASIAAPIPNNPVLAGAELYFQWGVMGASFPATMEMTEGLKVVVR